MNTLQEGKFAVVVDGQKVTGEVIAIDPAFAKELLDTMVDNRNVRQKAVDGMARAMAKGDFPFCADPIRINSRGELDDGEHRLRAVIQSDTTQNMLVVMGLDPAARVKYDSGTGRRAADQVRMGLRIPNANQVSAAAALLIKWEADDLVSRQIKPTVSEVYDYASHHLEILQEGVRHQQSLMREIGVGTATAAAVYVRAARMNPAEADTFFKRLACTCTCGAGTVSGTATP
jgi:hypothetical protein